MNNLVDTLAQKKADGQKILIPYLTAGDPNLEVTLQLMLSLAANCGDVIELGVPFSDPLADGPILQAAAQRALAAGVTLNNIFSLVARFRQMSNLPIILLVYYNQIYRYGCKQFCERAQEAGVDGLVVPDLPFEEAAVLDSAAQDAGLVNIRFLSPTTEDTRLAQICKGAQGFIYCVSVTGVTGERSELDTGIPKMLAKAKALTDTPLALGFGISSPEHAQTVTAYADAVIVGSALVSRISRHEDDDAKIKEAANFVYALKEAITGGAGHV